MQHDELSASRPTDYGGYEGNRLSALTYAETSAERLLTDTQGGKITPLSHSSQNSLRFAIAAMSMLTLIALTVICLLFIGGVGGWISFLVAGGVVLGVAITTTNGNR